MENSSGTNFEWVIFFEEMATNLLAFRRKQKTLVNILKNAGVKGLQDQDPEGTQVDLDEIDPFTFTSLICKHHGVNRSAILRKISVPLGIKATVPTQFSGVPNVDPRQAWLFPYKYERMRDDVGRLWDLYEEVVAGHVTDPVFDFARFVRYAGSAKLTQAIFRAAPSKFFPIDGQTKSYLIKIGISNQYSNAGEYQKICEKVQSTNQKPFVHSYLAWLSNQEGPKSEAQYQEAVLKKATSVRIEPPTQGGDPVPPRIIGGSGGGYQRKVEVAAQALKNANFKCEIDRRHETFISSSKGVQYVEAHHLVPMSRQAEYQVSLDVIGNIIALCPNCHRLLHHGKGGAKKDHLRTLLQKRVEQLKGKEITLGISTLLSYYSDTLLLEDD